MKTNATTPKASYVIVSDPATADEQVMGRIYYGASEPFRRKHELEEAYPNSTFDVMKRLDDGTLTTEF